MAFRSKTPSVSKLIRNNNMTLKRLQARCQLHEQLLQQIRVVLPADLADHCCGCSLTLNKLTVYATSPAWIAQTRFYQTVILQSVNATQVGKDIQNVSFRVQVIPHGATTNQSSRKPMDVSINTIRHIYDSSSSVSDDQLKQSLQQLANTLLAKHS